MNDEKSLPELLRSVKLPIVIFGASVTGEAVLQACREAGIRVTAFCDNNLDKAKEKYCGLEVVHRPRLKERFPDALFLVAVIDIGDIVPQLTQMGYAHIHSCAGLLRNFDVYAYSYSKPADFVNYVISACILSHDCYSSPDKLFLRSVDVVVTERCSLRCRDCSNLMQYYRKPVNYDTATLMHSLDVLCGTVDEINEFRVIGGEPFMNREWLTVTRRLIAEPKVRKVIIYTNATILPPDGQLAELPGTKVLFIVTDYGPLSRKLGELIAKLKEFHIPYSCTPAGGWTDCAGIVPHGRTPEENRGLFANCCVKNSYTLTDGKLYRCPFAANADALMAIPDAPEDRVDLLDGAPHDAMRERLKSFVFDKQSILACDFCSGRRLGDPQITPAIQADKPLDYKIYER
ncbi:MAG: radical SAM protein [Lentisphaeria bacterium]|nr:radical SAM protein [Lentisphaeria bacterium]